MSGDMLSIGASGVRAYQGALATVSENIANVGTPGYARRTATVQEVVARGQSGVGVHMSGVSRSADPYRAADVRRAGADLARTATGVTWLDRVETALSGNQLAVRLTSFFGAAQTLAADPSATAPRAAMLEAGQTLADAFTATGASLDHLTEELDATAGDAAVRLGSLAAALARINVAVGRLAGGNTDAAANLADQRDGILEQMSALSDVSVRIDDFGRASVRVGGATGPMLVAGDVASTVNYARDVNGATGFSVSYTGETHSFGPAGGVLAGVADVASRIADSKALLSAVATDFVTQVNAVQAAGRDLDGNPGAALFAQGSDPMKVSLTLGAARGIAAAAVGGGMRDNANLVALQALRSSGNYETRVTDIAADNGAVLASRRTVAAAQGAIRDGAVTARDGVSAVDLDSEAVDLMRFQQAYQASGRVIQIARDTLQSILDIR